MHSIVRRLPSWVPTAVLLAAVPMWQNLLRYIEGLDVDAIKAQVAQQGPWQ